MDSARDEHLHNLRSEVAARPATAINLDAYATGEGEARRFCLAGLVAAMPYFRAFGVIGPDTKGAPLFRGRDGDVDDADKGLEVMFGPFPDGDAVGSLFAWFGNGRWDTQLIAGCGGQASHQQLALARLDMALRYCGATPVHEGAVQPVAV